MTDQPTDDELADQAVEHMRLDVIRHARGRADLIEEMIKYTPATWVTTINHMRAAASSLRWQANWEERHPPGLQYRRDQP